MFITTQSGELLNLALCELVYIAELKTAYHVCAETSGGSTLVIAVCETREEALALMGEIQDALASRNMCRVLMSIPNKRSTPASAGVP